VAARRILARLMDEHPRPSDIEEGSVIQPRHLTGPRPGRPNTLVSRRERASAQCPVACAFRLRSVPATHAEPACYATGRLSHELDRDCDATRVACAFEVADGVSGLGQWVGPIEDRRDLSGVEERV
jgi:hypothetical protein